MESINRLYQAFLQSTGICTDTRKIEKGSLFFALKGASFNGNQFAGLALESGASVAVIDEGDVSDERYIKVKDTLEALQQLAFHHRKQLAIPVIAIVGSNGKTTTKELLTQVLSTRYKVLSTPGNFNNHIGLPLTLLMAKPEHEILVIEMGANHEKENALLCEIAAPDYGIVTNNGKDHLEGFGSIEGVIRSNAELYSYLRNTNGMAFVNAHDPVLLRESEGLSKRVLYAACSNNRIAQADYVLEATRLQPDILTSIGEEQTVSVLSGDYNFDNITAAACIGAYFGLSNSEISSGISAYAPSNLRSQWVKKSANIVFLDAYNANPSSMELSIRNFMAMPLENKLLILGDMFELGPYEAAEHAELSKQMELISDAEVWLVGKAFYACSTQLTKFETTAAVIHRLKENPPSNKSIFLKGSRGMKLEQLVEFIP